MKNYKTIVSIFLLIFMVLFIVSFLYEIADLFLISGFFTLYLFAGLFIASNTK